MRICFFVFFVQKTQKNVGGAAYNPETDLIYISQQNAENSKGAPVIHAFKVNSNNTDNTDNINPTASCECAPYLLLPMRLIELAPLLNCNPPCNKPIATMESASNAKVYHSAELQLEQ